MGHLVYHPEGDGKDGAAGEAAHRIGEDGFAAGNVYPHPQEGIDQGETVRPGILAGAGYLHDICHVGTQFDEDGFAVTGFLDGRCHLRRRCSGGPEGQTAAVHVGAGDIDFDQVDSFTLIGPGAAFAVFFHREAADIGYDAAVVQAAQRGYFFVDQHVYAGVLQAYGIDHSGRAVCDAGNGIAVAGFPRAALEGDASQHVQIHGIGHFQAEAEGAAGGDYRVFQA